MIGLEVLLGRPDPVNQKLSLEALGACICHLPPDLRQEYLDIVQKFISSKYSELRSRAFEILKVSIADPGTGEELKRTCLKGLMVGLADNNEDIRTSLWDYFTSLESMPRGSFDRMKHILKNLYFAKNEPILLSQLPNLLLALARQSPNFTKLLFIPAAAEGGREEDRDER